MNLYKLVVRDMHGKVVQIHERYQVDIAEIVRSECERGYSVTITLLYRKV